TREQIQVFSFGVFLLSALVSGALVALAEEVLFRGVVPEVIRRAFGASSVFLAGCLSSLAYACIHVLAAPVGVDVDVTPWSGLGVVLASTAPLGTPSDYWDSFSALFLLGLGLCIVRYATGSLMWCLGLHAAFVTSIRVFKELTLRDSFNDYAYLAGGSDHFIGILVAGWLLMLIAAAGVYLSRGQIRSLRPTPLLSRRSDVT
ncbi:MAG: CPBP family intramembrane metalloprotease, partial [Proteobacteria bacterium]|nr:CPBP family intramembrane metalloprotease [Pseudomonadota bacterium]